MATANFAFGPVGSYPRPRPTQVLKVRAAETITTSGTPQQTTNVAAPTGGYEEFVQVTVSGGNVYLEFGDNPTAAAASADAVLVLDGQTRDFALGRGEKVSVIDA